MIEQLVRDIYWAKLLDKNQESRTIRRQTGGYDEQVTPKKIKLARLSSSGDCPLKQYLDITQVMESGRVEEVLDARQLSIFEDGNIFESFLYDLLNAPLAQESYPEEINYLKETQIKWEAKDAQKVVYLKFGDDTISGRIDGIFNIEDKPYLLEFKTTGMEQADWDTIFFKDTIDDLINYCLTNSPRTVDKNKWYIFKYICQINAYLEGLENLGYSDKLTSAILIVKSKRTAKLAIKEIPVSMAVREYYRNNWQLVLDGLRTGTPPDKPDKYKLKSGYPCDNCVNKHNCFPKPVANSMDLLDL